MVDSSMSIDGTLASKSFSPHTSQEWVRRTIQIPMRLGEKRLFSLKLDCVELKTHFTNLGDDPMDTFESAGDLAASGVNAVLLRSHPIPEKMPAVTFMPGYIRYAPNQYQRYFVELNRGDFQAYLAKFSSKSRSTLTRKVRKYSEFCGGEIRARLFQLPDEVAEFHRLAREISQKTYQERLLQSGIPDGPEFSEELRLSAASDRFRGHILFHGEKPVAYVCCPIVEDGILIYQYVGYDPEYAQWSPGTVQLYLFLEDLFRENRFQCFDFTEGEGQHKEFFATGSRYCADVYFMRRNPSNFILFALHRSLSQCSRSGVRLLKQLGVKERVKQWLRHRA